MRLPGIDVPIPIPGFDPIGSLLSALSDAISRGVHQVAAWAFDKMTSALLATTQVHLFGWFDSPWQAMIAVSAVLAIPILLVGVASEVLAGRPGQAARRGIVLPLLIGPVLLVARALLGLALAAVNSACALVVTVGIGGSDGYAAALGRMRHLLGAGTLPAAGGPALLIVTLVAALLAAVIWIELAVRAALIYLLAAFIPLALAGLFWSATARWARRLAEVLAAAVLAQLVITVVMVLAAAALAHPADGLASGVDDLAVGLALMLLGSLGLPLTFRVIPHVAEAAAITGTGAMIAAKAGRGGQRLASFAPTAAGRFAGASAASRARAPQATTNLAAGKPPRDRPANGEASGSSGDGGHRDRGDRR
jgi:hypothetical protein